ncbi:MAG: DNA polymerase III subunit delta [Anaerolineae bacterium]|nr:DNA polymerase III subunit delta [Anaerolineae bacterium]
MFYLFHGDNAHAQQEALAILQAKSGDADMLALNTTRLDGKGLSLNTIRNTSSAMPFLSPVRLVIVEDYFVGKPAKEDVKALVDWLPTMPQFTRLVFLESKALRASHAVLKLAREKGSNGYERAYDLPKGGQLDRWIMQRTQEKGAEITPRAANVLATNVGSDLFILDNEIEKLVLYRNGQTIRPIDVEKLSPYVAEANIFDLVDALGNRNGRQAAQLFQHTLDDGMDPFYLFAMFVRQFRLLIQVKESAEAGLRPPDIAKALKQHPFVVGKLYQQAKSFSIAQLEQIYAYLLDIDVQVKTGKSDMTTSLSLLVAGLAD